MGLFGTGTASGDGLLGRASSAASSLFDSLRQEDGEFTYIEDEVGIPRGTLYALMMAESEQWALQGQVTPKSTDGALGPFQLLPETARHHKANPYNLHEAARAAAHEIKMGLNKTGSLDKALAIYSYGYGKSRKQNFDLNKIDKMQGDKETKKHRERFHKYHGEPEKNLDWMQPLMGRQQEQYAAEQPLKKWMYPQPKDGAVREGQQQKEKELEIYGLSGNFTTEGRPMYHNNFGGESSEYSIGVKDERINNKALTHIPSIYDGRILNQEDAIQRVVDANGYDPLTGRFIEPGGDPEARSRSIVGIPRTESPYKRLMYPPPKTLQEVTATSQARPALRPPNSLSALEQLNEYKKMFSGKSLASQINSRSFNPSR